MSLSAEEEMELAALLEEEAGEWMTRSKEQQDRARNIQGARDTAELMTSEPPTGDKALAVGMGVGDALGPAAMAKRAAATLGAPVSQLTGSDTAGLVAGGALSLIGAPALPVILPPLTALDKLLYGDKGGKAAQEQEAATQEMIDSPLGGHYAAGNLGASLVSAGTGLGGPARTILKEGPRAAVQSLKQEAGDIAAPVLERLKGAGRELTRETLEGGGQPTKMGMLKRAVGALRGEGGEVSPSMIEGVEELAHPTLIPRAPTVTPKDVAGYAAPKPTTDLPPLTLKRNPAVADGASGYVAPKPPAAKPPVAGPADAVQPAPVADAPLQRPTLVPKSPDMPADVMAGMPPLQPKPPAPAPQPSAPPPGTPQLQKRQGLTPAAERAIARKDDLRVRWDSMPAEQQSAEVSKLVSEGLSLSAISRKLGIPQRELNALVKKAQFSNPLPSSAPQADPQLVAAIKDAGAKRDAGNAGPIREIMDHLTRQGMSIDEQLKLMQAAGVAVQ